MSADKLNVVEAAGSGTPSARSLHILGVVSGLAAGAWIVVLVVVMLAALGGCGWLLAKYTRFS